MASLSSVDASPRWRRCARSPARVAGGWRGTPGHQLEIVGHGTYDRQVLGLGAPGGQVVIPVRRDLCCGCRATTSVLPDVLYPGRWYGAWVILEAVVLVFVLGLPIDDVRREFGIETSTPHTCS